MPAHRSLGDLLVAEGLLDQAGVESAARTARRLGVALVTALLEERLVEPGELLDLLRDRLKLPDVDLDRVIVEPDAVRALPFAFAEQHALLPVALERRGGRSLMRVVMADPLDQAAIDEIEFTTGCRVEPALALATDLAAAVQRHYRAVVTRVMQRQDASPPERRGRPAADVGPAGAPAPRTEPAHRLEDVAPAELRVRALLNALIRRGVLAEDEYVEELRELLKQGARED
ncbi:MAG: hypothetical protein HY906_19115 [Deltaproteobacteria bacterium]|nr:hypothetical protein [Deltaproteobacteria bacterium]